MNVRRYKRLVEKVQRCNEGYNKYYRGELIGTSLKKLDNKLMFFENELKKVSKALKHSEMDELNNYYGVLIF